MKSFKELLTETLNQRHIVDNRQVVTVAEVTPSVLIAFHQACQDMLNACNWVWNQKKISYTTQADRTAYPMPFGIVDKLVLTDNNTGNECSLDYAIELTAKEGCPTQWSHDWENEEIAIAPAERDAEHTMTIYFRDKHIACIGPRSDNNLLEDFDDSGELADPTNQFLNVPKLIYEPYARCIVTLTRVYLNEGSQPSVLAEQKAEFNKAYNTLLEFAKTPFYEGQRFEI